jgi:hypothetical protein
MDTQMVLLVMSFTASVLVVIMCAHRAVHLAKQLWG